MEPIVSEFGRCEMGFSRQGNGALYTSQFALNERYIGLDKYEAYYNFMESSKNNTRIKIVLIQ